MIGDSHLVLVIGFGALALLVAWLPLVLQRLPLSLPMVCLLLGFVAVGPLADVTTETYTRAIVLERLTEAILIVAVMGAGLSIDRRIGWRRWNSTWRLLAVAMPLGIAAMAGLSFRYGHFSAPAALILASLLAPTDPVLASDLRVGLPGTGEEGEVRQALTSEAGLNDGLAAPFIALGLLLFAGNRVTPAWLADYFLWRVVFGAAVGWGLGAFIGWLQFQALNVRESLTADGLAAIGVAFLAYGVAETLGGYGFVAVFLCAVRLRQTYRDDETHRRMAEFAGQIEHLLAMLVIVLFAAAILAGLLAPLTPIDAVLAAGFLLVVRPLSAWMALIGAPHPFVSRAATAFFGIRGIGTLYYLIFVLNRARLPEQSRIVALAGTVVLGSILLHGVTAAPVMRKLDRLRQAQRRRPRE